MNKGPLRISSCILVLALAITAAVTYSAYGSPSKASSQAWIWPPAPDKPRIQYLKTFITPQDLDIKKGFFAKVWEFIAGKDAADRVISPHGVTANGEGKVYIADWGGASVHFFDLEKKKYDKFSRTKNGPLVSPIGVALDADGLVYVSDSVRRRVFVFDGSRNRRIIGDDSLLRPTGIAINKKEKILYVVDTAGQKVEVFDLKGNRISSFGSHGSEDGRFNYPTHIATDADGDIYVMDSMNFRVQIFDKNGRFLSKFGGTGTSIHDFIKPKGIAVDSERHIWVSDSMRNTIQVFDRQGRLLLIFGRIGAGPGEFNIPAGLYMDSKDKLYVADSYNYRVQSYQYLKQ